MQAELIEMGTQLKRRREERSLSLKEVENSTSIRVGHLESIELGHFGKLISPIYAQGFVKKYAAFLGFDADELLAQYPYVTKVLHEKPSEEFSLLSSVEVRSAPGSEVKWLPNFLWVTGSAALIVGGFFVARKFGFF